MKRKKWSEAEEQTLLSKYSDLLRSGTLPKLKTREKKFKPIADHVNAVHHLRDPTTFPFKWSWRDVSIKVQNMRHQYLGVKQKICVSPHHFNWNDGTIHWENFLAYKHVFGDIHLHHHPNPNNKKQQQQQQQQQHNPHDDLGFQFDDDDDEDDDDSDALGSILELRDAVVKREERRREREFRKEKIEIEIQKRRGTEFDFDFDMELELELGERRLRFEAEKRARAERELEEERRRRKRAEERMEEEMMEWKERMVAMQVEHEKQIMQMQVDACQNQMQILGIMARLFSQFFGSGTDGLGGAGLGALPPQVLHHATGLGDVKPDANSQSEFI